MFCSLTPRLWQVKGEVPLHGQGHQWRKEGSICVFSVPNALYRPRRSDSIRVMFSTSLYHTVTGIAAIGLYARTTPTRHGLFMAAAMNIHVTRFISELTSVSSIMALKDPRFARFRCTRLNT
ncbi:hypothetical protein TNCV_2484361 [Trichonephila clavipes]|uniref:Uncharacterized protein n=1 Tax=Trichonephila clavipes TaxID=2585209 RepID=A0A8X6VZX6_TRICX|nr:hypothetical protein TNCV_2484361 [Trichonephila clavipes]